MGGLLSARMPVGVLLSDRSICRSLAIGKHILGLKARPLFWDSNEEYQIVLDGVLGLPCRLRRVAFGKIYMRRPTSCGLQAFFKPYCLKKVYGGSRSQFEF